MRTPRAVEFAQVKRVPLLAILSRYGVLETLKRSGTQLRGSCPLHSGNSRKRNFVVNPSTSEWKCFGDCDAGGSTLEFVARKERVSVHDAALLISAWFGLAPIATTAPQQWRSVMSETSLPSHRAFIVEDAAEGSDKKPFWHRVGSAWTFSTAKSSGINVVLTPGISISGRIVLLEYTEEQREQERRDREARHEQEDDPKAKRKR